MLVNEQLNMLIEIFSGNFLAYVIGYSFDKLPTTHIVGNIAISYTYIRSNTCTCLEISM